MNLNEDITDKLTPRTREILLRYQRSKRPSKKAFLAANPDITPADMAAVTLELMAITGSPAETGTKGSTRPRRAQARATDAAALAYQLKVTLTGTKPSVWRRVVVPGAVTLDRLHDVIQVVMGWTDSHLHAFDFGGRRFSERHGAGDLEELQAEDESKYRLGDLVNKRGAKFAYEYDFGDGWQHVIAVEAITPVPPNHRVATACLAGKRRCPPEDVGGVYGYIHFLEAYLDPKHPGYRDMHEWRGDAFDPEAFDLDAINRELLKLSRWSRKRQ